MRSKRLIAANLAASDYKEGRGVGTAKAIVLDAVGPGVSIYI